MCGVVKPVEDFHPRKDAKDGRRNDCRECNLVKQRAYWHGTQDERHARQKAHYEANKQKIVQARREFRRTDGERINATRRARHAEDPDRNRALARERYARAPAIKRAQDRARRFRKRTVKWTLLLERDDGVCGICGSPVDPAAFHVDHIIPRKHGGPDVLENLQLSHPRCNQRKGTSTKEPYQVRLVF